MGRGIWELGRKVGKRGTWSSAATRCYKNLGVCGGSAAPLPGE